MKGFTPIYLLIIAALLSVTAFQAYQLNKASHKYSVPVVKESSSSAKQLESLATPSSKPITIPALKTTAPASTPPPTTIYQSSVRLESVNPSSADYGQIITLKGLGFGSTAGHVSFYNPSGQNSGWGPTESWSDSEIKLKVPPFQGGYEFQIEVQHADNTKSNKKSLKVTNGQPYIQSVRPENITANGEITVNGRGFGSSTGTIKLSTYDPKSTQSQEIGNAQIVSWSEGEIRFKAPRNIDSNLKYDMFVIASDGRSSSLTPFGPGSWVGTH